MKKRKIYILTALGIILISLFLFLGLKSTNWRYLLSKRTPKIIAILITGISISLSSLIFQTVTNNRILTPSILGLDSLYMLIQTLVVFLLGSSSIFIRNSSINFFVTVILMLMFSSVLYKFLFIKEDSNILKLLLVGMILGTLFQSISSFMQMMIDPNEFMHIQGKMFASFNNVNTNILALTSLIIGFVVIYSFKFTKILDVLALGREQSINLGIDYDKIIKRLLFIVSILVSVSTALVGPVTFLGLLVVNLAREVMKTFEHKYLFIVSSLLGIVFLIGGQLLIERIFNFGIPISVIINFIGGVYFIHLLLKQSGNMSRDNF
ncbi:MAG: iron chelate uptake ABC transporter family permease subunit [Tissierella sp.]|uniref:iron chelate uptake ABC transporter family permease subunit n=1 Tax=Tissierella sp. TaxID=41274 RepID=UPI003F9D8871